MPAGRKSSFLVTAFLALVFTCVGGGLMFFWAIPSYFRARASTSWPTVDGRIDTSRLESARDKNKTNYWASVQFSYDVKGQSYQSDDIWAGGGYRSTSKQTHQDVVDRYPPLKQVKVYYDPAKPDFGILEPGVNFSNYMILLVSGIFLTVGVLMGGYCALMVLFILRTA